MNLSDRVRAGSEAAPWVIDEIRKLERSQSALRDVITRQRDQIRLLKHGVGKPDQVHALVVRMFAHEATTSTCSGQRQPAEGCACQACMLAEAAGLMGFKTKAEARKAVRSGQA